MLLIIGGGIAAYKSLELIRLLKKRGIDTRAVMTKAATGIRHAAGGGALRGERCSRPVFDQTDEFEIGHIELSRAAISSSSSPRRRT